MKSVCSLELCAPSDGTIQVCISDEGPCSTRGRDLFGETLGQGSLSVGPTEVAVSLSRAPALEA